jgi:hypothetical protein
VSVAILDAYRSTRFTFDQSPGRICARALLAVSSFSYEVRAGVLEQPTIYQKDHLAALQMTLLGL